MSIYMLLNEIILILIFYLPINNCIDTIVLNNILLQEHNKYRKKHGVPNLELDNDLIKGATAYAESLAKNADPNYLVPSNNYYMGDEKLGENLFQCSKKTCQMENFTQPLDIWYNEIEFYNFNKNEGDKSTANFTQMVWKSTKKLGCGVGQKTETSYKVVCHYLPKGNIYEKYDINVLPVQTVKEQNEKDNTNNNFNGTYEEYITKGSFNLKKKFYLFELGFILCLLFI